MTTDELKMVVSGVNWISVTQTRADRVHQITQNHIRSLQTFESELVSFNQKHNLISRSAENHVFQQHIRHCLSIACFDFPQEAHIIDWGSGGGLPAIPLAIVFSSVQVTAVDKVGKKMLALEAIARRLCLLNVAVYHGPADTFSAVAAYSVSRATAPLLSLWQWHRGGLVFGGANVPGSADAPGSADVSGSTDPAISSAIDWGVDSCLSGESRYWPGGLICLKGGDIRQEVADLTGTDADIRVSGFSLEQLYDDPYYREKYLLHVQTVKRA